MVPNHTSPTHKVIKAIPVQFVIQIHISWCIGHLIQVLVCRIFEQLFLLARDLIQKNKVTNDSLQLQIIKFNIIVHTWRQLKESPFRQGSCTLTASSASTWFLVGFRLWSPVATDVAEARRARNTVCMLQSQRHRLLDN